MSTPTGANILLLLWRGLNSPKMDYLLGNDARFQYLRNAASAKGQQFSGHVLVLDDQSYDFSFGSFDKPVESRVMLLHASVTKVVTDSARKRLEPRRPVQFERSAATHWTEQAQALARSARWEQTEPKSKLEAAQSIRRSNNFAILYRDTRDDVRRSAHDFLQK
jgi:hypothetical protein